ncbi:phosphoglycerate mutase-like protein AT74H [Malus domestica]|uniref:phosphoglycerate mutase-like protein AT74H n=1 Tax=Malus domestica TaxID=3750 RepID=UPI0039757E5F
MRHGESQWNLDTAVYTITPDNKIPLTQEDLAQAQFVGAKIHRIVSDATGADSPNWKCVIEVRDECQIWEQDLWNFQVQERMKAIKETRKRFGWFFYQFSDRESTVDVYDRVSNSPTSLIISSISQPRSHTDQSTTS